MKISVVIPCYNEEKVIRTTYDRVSSVVKGLGMDYEIVLEEEGSTDETGRILREIQRKDEHVRALSYPGIRMGLGWGWKRLFEAATGDLIVMMDADLSVEPTIVADFVKEIEDADIIVASRYMSERATLPLHRKLASRIYYLINKILFGLTVKDSQSGFQAYNRKVIDQVKLESNGFEINLELLVRSLRKGFRVKEIPATYIHREDAKFSLLNHGPKTLVGTLSLWYKLNFGSSD